MFSETFVSRAFAVRRRQGSPTATGQRLPSSFFKAVSEALAIPGDTGTRDVALGHDADHGMERSQWFVSVTWKWASLMCCGRTPDGPAAESDAKERDSWTKVSEGDEAGQGDRSNQKKPIHVL